MIKSLQRRFVVAAMIAITGLILLLLGAINAANLVLISQRIDRTLNLLCDTAGDAGSLPPMPKPAPDSSPFPFSVHHDRKVDHNAFISSNFFVVRFGADREPIFVDVSRLYTISENEALELASEVLDRGGGRGEYGRFRYLIKDVQMRDTVTVFLDTSGESGSFWRVLLLSAGIGLAGWGLMLAFVVLLSKRAIRPIAENIQRQKQFVTNAGHEIKTPLAIIQSNTEAMELYNGENKWSRNIKEQTARLSGLVKDLLLLARMDEGTVQAEPSDFSISELFEDSLDGFSQPIDDKSVRLNSNIPGGITIHADRKQTCQLISILLDNAIKYTNDGGEITAALEEKAEGRVTIRLQNTCTALPDVPPDKLFDRFYRADTARTQKSGGYGIGLAMARSLAEANRAAISAKYIMPNAVCFTVKFRL